MNNETLKGSCLCGSCQYSITSELMNFFQCHCEQCQKTTASAFAANIIAQPSEIKWITGADNIKRYDHPERGFTQVFCLTCGSGLPFIDDDLGALFIPSGTLDVSPSIKPEANIFWSERAKWLEHGIAAPKQETFNDT